MIIFRHPCVSQENSKSAPGKRSITRQRCPEDGMRRKEWPSISFEEKQSLAFNLSNGLSMLGDRLYSVQCKPRRWRGIISSKSSHVKRNACGWKRVLEKECSKKIHKSKLIDKSTKINKSKRIGVVLKRSVCTYLHVADLRCRFRTHC